MISNSSRHWSFRAVAIFSLVTVGSAIASGSSTKDATAKYYKDEIYRTTDHDPVSKTQSSWSIWTQSLATKFESVVQGVKRKLGLSASDASSNQKNQDSKNGVKATSQKSDSESQPHDSQVKRTSTDSQQVPHSQSDSEDHAAATSQKQIKAEESSKVKKESDSSAIPPISNPESDHSTLASALHNAYNSQDMSQASESSILSPKFWKNLLGFVLCVCIIGVMIILVYKLYKRHEKTYSGESDSDIEEEEEQYYVEYEDKDNVSNTIKRMLGNLYNIDVTGRIKGLGTKISNL